MSTSNGTTDNKMSIDDLVDQALVLGSSLVYLAKDSAEDIVSELEKRNLLKTQQGKATAKEIRTHFTKRKDQLHGLVVKQLKTVIDDLGIATKEDLKKVTKK